MRIILPFFGGEFPFETAKPSFNIAQLDGEESLKKSDDDLGGQRTPGTGRNARHMYK